TVAPRRSGTALRPVPSRPRRSPAGAAPRRTPPARPGPARAPRPRRPGSPTGQGEARSGWRHPLRAPGHRSHPRLLAHLERLDDVADLDVVVVAEGQTALVALADLGRVVLEPLERGDGEVLRHHHAVAQQPGLGVAPQYPGPDDAAGDVAELG